MKQTLLLWFSLAMFAVSAMLACAAFAPEASYALAQDQCTADAATRAQDDDCRCRVRQRYPSAPQCAALPDGGWALPTAATIDGGIR